MSSPESDDRKIFLPSMLRKSGGVFGQTLTNALMNKVKATTTTSSTNPTDYHLTPSMSEVPIEKTDSISSGIANTLDSVARYQLLKDVRSQRAKAPFTRPKSTHILREQLDSVDIPANNLDEPEVFLETTARKLSEPSFKITHIQNQSTSRQPAFKKNSENAVSIGNIEAPDISKLPSSSSDEVDWTRAKNKTIAKGFHHSKSSEGLNVCYDLPKTTITPSKVFTAIGTGDNKDKDKGKDTVGDPTQKGVDKQSMKLLKNTVLTLARNVKSIEENLTTMKMELRHLAQLIHEIEGDKK